MNNPERILYGRLDGFELSERGEQMASRLANYFHDQPIVRVISSPLIRTTQTATPIAKAKGVVVDIDERLIEGTNAFQGGRVTAKRLLGTPTLWPLLRNPLRPSWGEPYAEIAARMMAALDDARESVSSGDVVLVTHQLPIWMVHRQVAGVPLAHLPGSRRCSLASVTSFHQQNGKWRELSYAEPAGELLSDAIDLGAV